MNIVRLDDLSVDLLRQARRLSATDGVIAVLLWENPFETGEESVGVPIKFLSHEAIEPVRQRVVELLGVRSAGLLENQPEEG